LAEFKSVMMRIPGELAARVYDLLPRLAGTPAMSAVARPTFTALVRVALDRGLRQLEKEYPPDDGESQPDTAERGPR